MALSAHENPHSERGALRSEHPGRAADPVVKVTGLAWLEFEKPDLDRAQLFARDFGFAVAARTADALYLRGTRPGTHCLVIRRGAASRFVGPVFQAAEAGDLRRLADATGTEVRELGGPGGGRVVSLRDPSGILGSWSWCSPGGPRSACSTPTKQNADRM